MEHAPHGCNHDQNKLGHPHDWSDFMTFEVDNKCILCLLSKTMVCYGASFAENHM